MLNDNLYKLRMSNELTTKAMALIAKVERRTYENWESGESIPDLERLKKIIDHFDIKDIYQFVYGDGKKNILRLSRPKTIKKRKKLEIPKLVYKMI